MKKIIALGFIFCLIFSIVALGASRFNTEWEEVISNKSKLLEKDKVDKLVIKYELAVAYANLGQIEKATKIFKSFDQDKGEEKVKEIIPIYKQKLKRDPQNIRNINYLAFAYYINKQYQQAESIFKRLIKLDSNNIWSYNYLAVVQHQLKKYNKAHTSLEHSLKIENNEYTHFLIGVNYYKQGNVFKALYYISKGREAANLFL